MGAQNLHWTVAVALHQRTLHSMLPIVERHDQTKRSNAGGLTIPSR